MAQAESFSASTGTAFNSGAIVEANLNGTHVRTIRRHEMNPEPIAAGTSHLYWIDVNGYATSGWVVEANLDGTHARTIARNQEEPGGFAVAP